MRQNKRTVPPFVSSVLMLALAFPALSLAQDAPALQAKKEKLSYAFGVSSASAVQRQLPDPDLDLLMRGFKDALSGNPLLTEAEVNGAIADLQKQVNAQQAEISTVYTAMRGVTDALSRKAITETVAVAAIADLQGRLADLQGQAKMKQGEAGASAATAARRDDPTFPTVNTAENAPAFQNRKAKLSYAFGVTYATALQQQSLDIDLGLVSRGLKDAVSGKTLLTAREVSAAMTQLRKQATMTAAEANRKQGEAFLAENKTKEGVITQESGLQYKILKAGDGKKPTIDDTVVCHYRGILLDGTEFDSSYKGNQPAIFEVQRVMMGWREAFQLMPVGSKWQLFMPGNLAHWPGGARSGVGPGATLIFELELISINGK